MARDRVRDQVVLLAPEKAVALDPIGEAILTRVNGTDTLAQIVSDLAATFAAPEDQIMTDVQRFLMSLRARVFLKVHS